jgi:hypothetical protein
VKSQSAQSAKSESAKSAKSQAKNVRQFAKDLKSIKKAFTQLQQMQEVDSDISDSDESQGASHFPQFLHGDFPTEASAMTLNYSHFTFTQVEKEFERSVAKLFKQSQGKTIELDLREVILLDSQSMMDLFCNRALVMRTYNSDMSMKLKSNGGTMVVTKKAEVAGYHAPVWYDKHAITNILALRTVIKQYRVTYNSDEKMFVVHRDSAGEPNMEFRMHESGLHIYDPRTEALMFITTVSGNKEGFTKRQINGAEVTQTLYATLGYPSWKDFKWVLQSNQIKDCPVTAGPRRRCRFRDMGQKYCGVEREDHQEQACPGGQGLREGPGGAVEPAQRSIFVS